MFKKLASKYLNLDSFQASIVWLLESNNKKGVQKICKKRFSNIFRIVYQLRLDKTVSKLKKPFVTFLYHILSLLSLSHHSLSHIVKSRFCSHHACSQKRLNSSWALFVLAVYTVQHILYVVYCVLYFIHMYSRAHC